MLSAVNNKHEAFPAFADVSFGETGTSVRGSGNIVDSSRVLDTSTAPSSGWVLAPTKPYLPLNNQQGENSMNREHLEKPFLPEQIKRR
jgi:hypothetical protein